ncbi:protein FAR1-RELATED SEQUENCE 5-like [Ziziphus jujuba]|uniref:Protein FAR1-RELATED SEQUENCE 5-like n=1 Tax=Ziziphus jujuba TaxID=326968 RepID=A0ABM4AGM6_ZIZJJ|nr:protein FAR1-RELATED SEQUENCE 5-like [Ziziphus jujuba]
MLDDTGTQLYTPQVVEQKKPNVKQEFQTIEEAFQFYNAYARECGFSARMSTSKRKKGTNELIWKQFVCFKEGETNEHYQKKEKHTVQRSGERNRGLVRVGCKAKMTVVKSQTGPNWIVSQFVEEHNYALATPSKIHLLRSHRVVSAAKRGLSQQLSEANIPMCQQIRVLEIEADGPQNIGCVEKDIRNYGQREEKNPTFYFKCELDEESRLVRCFWADPFARRSYHFYGDVVVFDTTYNTNKYDMIFAPLAGVNHHGQTVIFGCALLSGEKTEFFIWLFNQLLDVMPRGAPQVIITDQDPTMTKDIAQVLPSTCHRYCIWHILNKFAEKINTMVYRDNYHWFKNIICNSETIEEFETSWAELLKNSNLGDNTWLRQMYEIRNKWVSVYFNHIFNAGMLSSQRAESSHAFFKRYISNKNSLMDFIVCFNRAINHQRHDELVADHIDVNEQPKLKTMCPMETQMVKIYTKRNFIIFQDELFESSAYFLSCTFEDDESVFYSVRKANGSCSSRNRQLKYNKLSDSVSCSCRLFNFNGIPCRHILAYFRIKQVMFLPSEYILRRWTKSAKIGKVWDNNG